MIRIKFLFYYIYYLPCFSILLILCYMVRTFFLIELKRVKEKDA